MQPLFDYVYSLNGTDFNKFDITSAQFSIQWNPFSEYMQTGTGRLEIDKKYPKISFQYTKSIPNLLSNSFDFSKVDFRIIHEIPYLSGQNTSFIFQGGLFWRSSINQFV